MPDLLSLETVHGKLTVWSKDVTQSRQQLAKTFSSRGLDYPAQDIQMPVAHLKACTPFACVFETGLQLKEPILFENKSYEFSFKFLDEVEAADVTHYLASVNDSFRLVDSTLRGTINFGNNIGWFRFSVKYRLIEQSSWKSFSIALQVVPLKMDMEHDLEQINQMIDSEYPLWRFSFVQKTDQNLNRTKRPHERFPLLWVAQFNSLCDELLRQIKYVCNSPHNRLQAIKRRVSVDKLRGRLSNRLENKIGELIKSGSENLRVTIESKRLSVDIMENRFVRMVLVSSQATLARFSSRAKAQNTERDTERLSEAFFAHIQHQQEKIEQHLAHPLFRELSTPDTDLFESLVLQKRAGYSGIYRIWQQLKLYLDVLGKDTAISLKVISELYEVWCVLEMRRQLLELGFIEKESLKARLQQKAFEKELVDGLGASFVFERQDGIRLRLAHEPSFGRPKDGRYNQIFSFGGEQRPDIVLEATFRNDEKIVWIFDAKYRVDSGAKGASRDLAPEDALNQMHRYRDALIYLSKHTATTARKSRPVIEAFVLYPGWYPDDEQKNVADSPYAVAIESIGIGAFPALPAQKNLWLFEFLKSRLGNGSEPEEFWYAPDALLAQDSVRIPPNGLSLRRQGAFMLLACIGESCSPSYLDEIALGTAKQFYLAESDLINAQINMNVLNDITHGGFVVPLEEEKGEVRFIYAVTKSTPFHKKILSEERAAYFGLNVDLSYFEFELCRIASLSVPAVVAPIGETGFKIVDFALFENEKILRNRAPRDALSRDGIVSKEKEKYESAR